MPGPELSASELVLLERRVLRPVALLFGALILVGVTGIDIPLPVQYLPFVVSLVLLGLPHGAVDHLVPGRLAGVRTAVSVSAVVAVYVVLGAAVLAGWAFAPALVAVGFIALTLFHWGQGDLYVLVRWYGAEHLRHRGLRAGALLVRGALPMVVPLLAHPDVYRRVLEQAASLFAPASAQALEWLTSPGTRMVAAVLFVGGAAAYLVTSSRSVRTRPGRRAWRVDAGEIVLLGVFFCTVPPILAVGLYFCLWHSLRHIVRLELIDDATRRELDPPALQAAIVRFCAAAAPLTFVAIGMLLALTALLWQDGAEPTALLGPYLVLLSALTLPHVVVVTWMDHRQRLWAAGPASSPAPSSSSPSSRNASTG